MAEAVKNSNRKRRPPSHFHQGYNQDNYQPSHGQYYSSRAAQTLKEQNRQNNQPFTILAMSKLLSKFINSTNKKFTELQIKRKQEQTLLLQKRAASSKLIKIAKNDQPFKQQQQRSTFKKRDISQAKDQTFRQQQSKQKYQQKSQKKIITNPPTISSFQAKNSKTLSVQNETSKNIYPTQDLYNIESMAKVSRQQLLKFIPKGADPSIFTNQLLSTINPNPPKTSIKQPQNPPKQPIRLIQFRQDSKLFKRASFHIGIAYNIHIQNIKKRNPNFTQQQLDPTYISRNLKQLNNSDLKRKQQQYDKNYKSQQQMLQRQQVPVQQNNKQDKLRPEQSNKKIEANKIKQEQKVLQIQKLVQNKNKQPVYIDLIDEQPQSLSQKSMQLMEQNEQKTIKQFVNNEKTNSSERPNKNNSSQMKQQIQEEIKEIQVQKSMTQKIQNQNKLQ